MSSESRPNVLCFVADQLRYDHLGFAGNDTVETPNVDDLSASGVTFDRAYANNPMCMPARATLFTGRNPHQHGVRSNGIPLRGDIPTVPEMLNEGGYRTHSSGKLHLHLYTLPPRQQLAHVLSDLGDRAEGEFARRLEREIEDVVGDLLGSPDAAGSDDGDADADADADAGFDADDYHAGFSDRAENPIADALEEIHVPKWSDGALLLQDVAERVVEDWPVETFSDDDWATFSDALEDRLASVFAEVGATSYADLAFDPAEFPEAREVWESGKVTHLPEPYYGFETTDFTGGHVNEIYGEYKNWLRDEHPDAYERIDFSHPENTLGSTFQVMEEWTLPEELHYNRWISDRSIDFLDDRAEADDDEPFFLWCSYPDPHNPYAAPEPWGSMYDADEVELPTRREGELDDLPPFYEDVRNGDFFQLQGLYTDPGPEIQDEAIREIIATTYGMVSHLDHEVGRVMSALEDRGLREDTVVIFLADHGEMMGDHWMIRKGPFQFEGLLRVPMVWSWPGHFPEGKRVDTVCSHTDFAPTLLDVCDVISPYATYEPEYRDSPSEWSGESLAPLLTGEVDDGEMDRSVVVENDEDYLGLRARTLITQDQKLTVYPGEEYGELFDLASDPDELHNRWDDPEFADAKNRLYRELVERLVEQEGGIPSRRNVA